MNSSREFYRGKRESFAINYLAQKSSYCRYCRHSFMHLFETIEENLWPLQIILSPGGYHIDVRLRFRGSSGGCVLTCNFFRNPVGM